MHAKSLRAVVPEESTKGQIQAPGSQIHLFSYLLISSSAGHIFHSFYSIRCTEILVYMEIYLYIY